MDLNQLAELGEELHRRERAVLEAEANLKKAQKALQDIAEIQIPEAMEDLGLAHFRTTSGFEIELEKHYHASITKENQTEAHRWLDEHGHGGMIKRNVLVAFNRDQETAARKLLADLRAAGYPGVKEEASVHSSTLRAWVKNRTEAGEEVPPSITTHIVTVATVKQ